MSWYCRPGRRDSRLQARGQGRGTMGLGGSPMANSQLPRAGIHTPCSCVSTSGRVNKSDRQFPGEGRWLQPGTLDNIRGQLLVPSIGTALENNPHGLSCTSRGCNRLSILTHPGGAPPQAGRQWSIDVVHVRWHMCMCTRQACSGRWPMDGRCSDPLSTRQRPCTSSPVSRGCGSWQNPSGRRSRTSPAC